MVGKNGESVLKKIITADDLASLVVVSTRQIRELTRRGVLKLAKDKNLRALKARYILGVSVPVFCEHLRDTLASDDPNEQLYQAARAERMQASARMTQLKLKEAEGQLYAAPAIEFCVINMHIAFKTGMQSIPSAISPLLVGKSHEEIHAILEEAIRSKLTELSNFKFKMRQAAKRVDTSAEENGDDD
jgi:phage terminase Nu1 subunit (DNA packaging protein)